MKKKRLLFVAYAIPYPFLAMWEDATFGTAWCYAAFALVLILLWRVSAKQKLTKIMLTGNAVSLLLSLLCISFVQSEKWLWYFKPFSAMQLPFFLMFFIVFLELFALRVHKGSADIRK